MRMIMHWIKSPGFKTRVQLEGMTEVQTENHGKMKDSDVGVDKWL